MGCSSNLAKSGPVLSFQTGRPRSPAESCVLGCCQQPLGGGGRLAIVPSARLRGKLSCSMAFKAQSGPTSLETHYGGNCTV